jgi:hypothetical protein
LETNYILYEKEGESNDRKVNQMIAESQYQVLKEYIELDDESRDAYDEVIANPDEYRIVVKQHYNETKASIEIGQSPIALGELIRVFYNATHRYDGNTIINLPGAEFCKALGKVAGAAIQKTIVINQMTEEMAGVKLSTDATCDMSYA